MSNFAHLHVHTEYSLLDGLCRITQLVEKVKELGHKAVAITDHGAMYGVVPFFNACKAAGIKPIIGVEAYFSATSRFDKQTRPGSDQYHLLLLAKNDVGYRNLIKLVSLANLEGFSYKPRMDFEILTKYHEGIICTTGCASSIINKKLQQQEDTQARDWLKKFHDLFLDDFYIELQSHPSLKMISELNQKLVEFSKEFGIPLVATNDAHYIGPDDARAQDALIAVGTRKLISDKNRLSMLDSPDFYLKSTSEMQAEFADFPQALENAGKIADMCNVEIPIGKMIFPAYPLKPGQTPEIALQEMAHQRLKERSPDAPQEIINRLNYELEVICNKGYASYFLIVQDFVNWAKAQGIRVGPGRGSAAGSLVSFVLGITSIDPILHNLPFERFMNPQRPSPPDIDIDIADESRDEVIRYVSEKYGEDHVAQIITFGTMEARASIRDIGRVLGMPFSEPDTVAKLIPVGNSLEQALATVFELQELYKEPKYKELIDLAKRVEGVSRHASVHAAGVIIADKPLTEYTPIQRESRLGKIVTQYDMYALDLNVSETAIGLLKMDFLGLRNLSILGRAIEFVRKQRDVDVDVSDIPLDDPKVYSMLSSGETTGVFQLESGGMRRVARSLKPSRFSDITAMVALYRPGPMELIDQFIAGKNDPKKIHYPHDDLKPVLEETYGIPVYQEQILQIANVFAGYSLGEADILRRAIGKKKRSILDKEKKRFIKGAAEKGYNKTIADTIWGFIDKFAGYGFNKAHSASYAMIAYQTAFMKVNYPVEYMAAFLSTEANSHSVNKEERISQAIEECRRMNIKVLPPDINQSQPGFSIQPHDKSLNKQAIRYGLGAIKNVGGAAIEAIMAAREAGEFRSVTDFCHRADSRKVNKKVVESLAQVGSFDVFGPRSAILSKLDALRSKGSSYQSKPDSDQDGLFAQEAVLVDIQDNLPQTPPLTVKEKVEYEKLLLGVYLTDHPFAASLDSIKHRVTVSIGDIDPNIHQKSVTLGGILIRVKKITTKRSNAEMAFITIEDKTGSVECVVFPKIFESVASLLVPNEPVLIRGNVEVRDDKPSVIVKGIEPVSTSDTSSYAPSFSASNSSTFTITIPRGTSKETLQSLGVLLKANAGDTSVELIIPNGHEPTRLKLPYTVAISDSLKHEIVTLLKPTNN